MHRMTRKLIATLVALLLLVPSTPLSSSYVTFKSPTGIFALAEEQADSPGDQLTPPEETFAPDGGQDAPLEETFAPDDGQDAPPEETFAPDDGQDAPPEETFAPDGGQDAPPEETFASDGGQDAPLEEILAPDGGQDAPPQETPATEATLEDTSTEEAGLLSKAPVLASGVTLLLDGVPVTQAQIDLSLADPAIILNAVVEPSASVAQKVDWKITPADRYATIAYGDASCTVMGTAPGIVTLTATAADGSGKKASCRITVLKRVTNVAVSGPKDLALGASARLTALVSPDDATNRAVAWTSGNPDVISVNSKGVATVKQLPVDPAARKVTITATAKDGSGSSGTLDITVYAAVTKVQILSGAAPITSLRLVMNDTLHPERGEAALSALLTPAAETLQEATWTCPNQNVLQILPDASDLNCRVVALAPGVTVLTATARDGSGKKAVVPVTVTALVESVDIDGPDTMVAGNSITLKASVTPANASNKTVMWTSSDNALATVTSKGVITAKNVPPVTAAQSVDITATAADGSGANFIYTIAILPRSTGVQIKVGDQPAVTERLVLNGSNELKLTAQVMPEGSMQDVTWTSSAPKVAIVNQEGLVTGVKPGAAVITATTKDGSKRSGSYAVNVVRLAESIALTGPAEVIEGGTAQLKAVVSPADTSNKAVTWEIREGEEAATVDAKGLLTAGDVEAATEVTVVAKAADGDTAESNPLKITIRPKAASVDILSGSARPVNEIIYLKTQKTLPLSAEVLSADATQRVTWVSSNKKVATVKSAGDLTVEVTGKAPGTATLTALSADGAAKDSLTLTVRNSAKYDLMLETYSDVTALYMDNSPAEGMWGSVYANGADLSEFESGDWTLTLKDGDPDDLPVKLTLSWVRDTYAEISYSDVLRAGTVTYTLKYNAGYGRYVAQEDVSLTVYDKTPDDAPTGISYPLAAMDMDYPGMTLTFDRTWITFTGGTVPAGVESWKAIWLPESIYDDNNCSFDRDADTVTIKFKKAGRYVVTAAAGYGTTTFVQEIPVTIKDGNKPLLAAAVELDAKVLYTGQGVDGGEGTIGRLRTASYDLTSEDVCEWKIERIDHGAANPVELFLSENQYISYRMNEGTGKVTYRATVTVGGLSAFKDFSVEVKKATSLPTGIKLPKTAYQIKPGDSLVFYENDIRFAKGSAPAGASVWKYYRGNWGEEYVKESSGVGYSRYTFKEEGQYILYAQIGFSNYALSKPITIVVSDGEAAPIKLTCDLEYPVLYAADDPDNSRWLGEVRAKNYEIDPSAGDTCEWAIERVGGSNDEADDPVAVTLDRESTSEISNNLYYQLNGNTGSVDFEVTLTIGAVSVSQQFTVTVKSPDNLPTGVSVSKTLYTAAPGTLVTVKDSSIQFAEGTVPQGAVVWREVWNEDGWNSVEFVEAAGGRGFIFYEPGRYIGYPVIGIGNYYCQSETPIEFVISDAAHPPLKLDVNENVALFATGEAEGELTPVKAVNFSLDTASGETCDWSFERLSGAADPDDDPVILSLDSSPDSTSASVGYSLNGGSGQVTYRVTLTVGAYSDSADITVTVAASVPANFPTGISLPQTSYEIDVDDSINFLLSSIDFKTGNAPSGVTVWRKYEMTGDNWEYVDVNREDWGLSCYFYSEDVYTLKATIGIGNYHFSQEITVTVG